MQVMTRTPSRLHLHVSSIQQYAEYNHWCRCCVPGCGARKLRSEYAQQLNTDAVNTSIHDATTNAAPKPVDKQSDEMPA